MLTSRDNEQLAKSSQAANLLVSDLRAMAEASNPLLADMALDLLAQAVQLENRLARIRSCTNPEPDHS